MLVSINYHGVILQPVTVLTNLQRGNIQTQTSQAEPDDFTLHNRAAMGELSAQDLRGGSVLDIRYKASLNYNELDVGKLPIKAFNFL